MVKDDSKKNPSFIAFFKLLLFDVKVEILLNCMAFFHGFFYTPSTATPAPRPPPLLTGTVIFLLMEGVEVVHNWTMFDFHGTCNSSVLIF